VLVLFGCVPQLLLSYIPPDPKEWERITAHKRTLYKSWTIELIVNPHETENFMGVSPQPAKHAASVPEAPLVQINTATIREMKKELLPEVVETEHVSEFVLVTFCVLLFQKFG
jgi:hypothetical protein